MNQKCDKCPFSSNCPECPYKIHIFHLPDVKLRGDDDPWLDGFIDAMDNKDYAIDMCQSKSGRKLWKESSPRLFRTAIESEAML